MASSVSKPPRALKAESARPAQVRFDAARTVAHHLVKRLDSTLRRAPLLPTASTPAPPACCNGYPVPVWLS